MQNSLKISKNTKSAKLQKVISSISLVVSSSLKRPPNHPAMLSLIFTIFLRSIPAISYLGLKNLNLKDSTKTILCLISNMEDEESNIDEERLEHTNIRNNLDDLANKTIMQAKTVFRKTKDSKEAKHMKNLIVELAINKYRATTKDIPEHIVRMYAERFAKFCYMVGNENKTKE